MNIIRRTLASPNIAQYLRCLSVHKSGKTEKSGGNFVPVYIFPYIRPFAVINRLKIYQTALTMTSIPGAFVLNELEYITNHAVTFVASLGLSGCIALYSLGSFTNKFIGFIYYDEERDLAKVSYADNWGRRKDVEVPTSDIVPLNELPVAPLDGLYFTFRRYSTKETLRFSIRFGIILDQDKIKKVL